MTYMIYTLAQIIEKTAEIVPDKVAFRCLDESLTYKELDRKANQLADFLIQSGVQKGDRVGIFMNRCLDTAIAVHGIFKSGAAYVPINPLMPINTVKLILEDCKIDHIITTPIQERKIKAITRATPQLKSVVGVKGIPGIKNETWEDIFVRDLSNYHSPLILASDLAFILYTSGSTGMPKGIMHTHYSGLSIAKLAVDLHDFTQEDTIGNFAPLHFDPSTFGFFASPLVGATTVIFPDAHMKMPLSLTALAAKEELTVWYSVPLTLVQVLLHGEIDKYDFSSLRWVLFIGEVFPLKHLRALMLKWPHTKFNNIYGPAETVASTYHILKEPPEIDSPIPIGVPWGDTECKVLNYRDEEVKPGEEGELVLRTSTLMHGYWNNIDLTEKSLYRKAIAPGFDHVYYRTGDQVFENESGELMFIGRNDRQIKLRGYRIEMDEIEVALLKHEEIEEAAVFLVNSAEGDKELSSAVRLIKGSKLSSSEILDFCKLYIANYSIPKSLEIMSDFPRTGSGKIDRNEISRILLTKE